MKTSFAKWRSKVGLSQDEAARALSKTTRMVQYWEKGIGPDGTSAAPSEDTRKIMWAIANKIDLQEWPA